MVKKSIQEVYESLGFHNPIDASKAMVCFTQALSNYIPNEKELSKAISAFMLACDLHFIEGQHIGRATAIKMEPSRN